MPATDPDISHILGSPDYMPSHINTALIRTSETISLQGGHLPTGIRQGI